ncbi:hypothetical protein HID58_008919, partial [Brassica napus]
MNILKQLVPEDNLTMSRSTTHSSTDERQYTKPIIPPTEKKFKLLCIPSYFNSNRAWVLTLETGKPLWRKIECEYHYVMYPYCTHRHMICINGVLYYLACIDISRSGDEVVIFTDNNERTLYMWLLEDADGINKWSINIYELPVSWKHPCTENFQIVGMTRTCDIILSPCKFSDPFYVFYYNVERKTLVARTEIQGLQELKCDRPIVNIFQDYVEDLKLMENCVIR